MSTHHQFAAVRQGLNLAPRHNNLNPVETFPLSFAQEGLWVLEQITPGTPAHNLPEAWSLRGPLNARWLRWSLEEIVKRHEALRTCFSEREGKPVQGVVEVKGLPLPLVDLTQRADKESLLQKWLAAEAQRPFDLKRAPLFRAGLYRLAQEEHVLFINMHHLVSDGWSQGVFMRELAELYSAAVTGREPRLLELPIQYGDYVLWQRESMEGSEVSKQLEYWQQKLHGMFSPLELPLDHSRPAHQSYRGSTEFFTLPKALVDDVKRLCRAENSTMFMVLLAAFKSLLHRYTRQEDIVVGAPMAGRDRMETEQLIGFFVNTQALRTDLSGDPTFLQLLARVRETVLGAFAHQGIPWEKLMKTLQPQRDLSRHPLFPVVFGLQTSEPDNWQLHGLEARRLELDNGAAKFDWTLLVTERGDVCHLRSEYSRDLFEAGTMRRLVNQFQLLLQCAVAAPEKRLSELPLLSGAERERLLNGWNQTTTAYERDQCIHELFEAEAANNPTDIALVFGGEQLTYAELNRRANQLARRLISCGVGPNALVGISLERSFEMVIAMLAILKAGGAYVPFERNYPTERLQFMLKDTAVQVLITNSQFETEAGLRPPCVICLDTEASALAKADSSNLQSRSKPEDLAYALYTSGSTGTPKAAAIPHRGVVRLVRSPNYVDISRQDIFLQFAPVSFDASTFEIWGALLNGAKLVIFPPHFPSLEELGRTIEQEKVTILWLTAGLFHQMVDHHLHRLRGLRFLLAGGEALSVSHTLKAVSQLRSCQIINGYGPTENTTFSCCYRVPATWRGGSSVPIGRPINGTEVYILDSQLQPVPVGVPGELYVGGDGLARGYLNRPGLTNDRFVPNPFSRETSKLYRTGDLARWLPEGNVEFLGRIDQQVKVRGHRVEPAEVELALLQQPDVREALVIARADKSGANHLIAYVVPQPDRTLTSTGLRDFLAAKLPQFLVPSHFVVLKELPLTTNGKVNRQALPDPDLTGADEPELVPPRTPTEQLVVAIWRDLLGCKTIGIHQNLFHLGCHSLLATQAISRIAKVFGVELPVRTVFESPTVAGLAEKVVSAQDSRRFGNLAESQPTHGDAPAKLLPRLEKLTNQEVEQWRSEPELNTALS